MFAVKNTAAFMVMALTDEAMSRHPTHDDRDKKSSLIKESSRTSKSRGLGQAREIADMRQRKGNGRDVIAASIQAALRLATGARAYRRPFAEGGAPPDERWWGTD